MPPGTLMYVPALRKYFVMEDDCEECDHNWKHGRKWHMDLWMGPDAVTQAVSHGLIACENQLTDMRARVRPGTVGSCR